VCASSGTPADEFAADFYWSSSQCPCSSSQGGASFAWVQRFGNGFQSSGLKGITFLVRPVRAF
jgi:hypothetical protein